MQLAKKICQSLIMILFIFSIFEIVLYSGGLIVKMKYSNKVDNDDYVILAIGESTTFGLGVNNNETFPYQLEGLLEQKYPDIEFTVINKGVPSQTSTSILRHIEFYMIEYQPNLVLSTFGTVDYNPWHNGLNSGQDSILSGLRTYKLFRVFIDYVLNYDDIENNNDVWIYFDRDSNPPDNWYSGFLTDTLEANYNAVIDIVKEYNSTIVMTSYLHRPELENELYRKIATENQVLYIDVFVQNRTEDMFTADKWHPSRKGHRIMAEKIFKETEPLITVS